MSRNVAVILMLTLLTVVAWGTFQIFRITTSSTIPQPTQKQIEKLDPNLDKNVFDNLKKSASSSAN